MSGNLGASISPHQPATIVLDNTRLEYEPWEMAFINGGAIMDEIPVSNRDIHEQVVFRDQQQQPVTNTTANPIEAVSTI